MSRIAIIGAGVSGLTCGQLLKDKHEATIFERDNVPGGLIKCRRVEGNLFHTCGGHVFNSKRRDVLDWFWSKFEQNIEFSKAERNAAVFMEDGAVIPYPIENHAYLLPKEIQASFVSDLIQMAKDQDYESSNFEEFLKHRFGETLYNLYFKPYNEKVWRRNLDTVPLSWLEGKLPMPTVAEMIFNNMNHVKEKDFVHSTFWYEKKDGSQFIANRLAEGLNIVYNSEIITIEFLQESKMWKVNNELFDQVIYCGNIKDMVKAVKGVDIRKYQKPVNALEYHGTTAVFCEIDKNPYSWIYQPSTIHESHRIICTGNFAPSNNSDSISPERITATIEFTDKISKEEILDNLKLIPFSPRYLEHQYHEYTYPIQDIHTKEMIKRLKSELKSYGFYFTGRFADWEYYNMDVAMGSAIDLCKTL